MSAPDLAEWITLHEEFPGEWCNAMGAALPDAVFDGWVEARLDTTGDLPMWRATTKDGTVHSSPTTLGLVDGVAMWDPEAMCVVAGCWDVPETSDCRVKFHRADWARWALLGGLR